MRILRAILWVCAIDTVVLGGGVAVAQNFPSKPIRIVTIEPGGGADFMSRVIAQALSASLGQQVIVENQGGASGLIGAQIVAKASPDGYTLFLDSNAFWTLPLIQTVSYDPLKDFAPVSLTNRAPNVLVVNPSLPVKSVQELIAFVKRRPGELNYGSGSTGSSNHLSAELFKSMAGVDMVRVNFKGTGPFLNALISGQVQLAFPIAISVTPHVKSGKLRLLAVTSAQPSVLVPEVPTVAASGLPGYESGVITGVFAPSKTSEAIISRLNQEIVRVLNSAEVKERFFNAGSEVVGSSPEQFSAAMKADMLRMGKVIKDAKIRIE